MSTPIPKGARSCRAFRGSGRSPTLWLGCACEALFVSVDDAGRDSGRCRMRSDANIGAIPRPQYVVVDADPRNGGDASLARLEAQYASWSLPQSC